MSGLRDRVVVVTRERERAGSLAGALGARGARPLLFPAIATAPPDDPGPLDRAVAQRADYDWIVFTSANAVQAVRDRLSRSGSAWGDRPRLAAVGEPTAVALVASGAAAVRIPGVFLGSRIAEVLGPLAGCRVLLPQADIARAETAAALRAGGAMVDEVVAYRTVGADPDPVAREALARGVDAVTFTSPSTVRHFVTLAGPDGLAAARKAVIACIGPTTGAAAQAAGFPAPLEAEPSTVGGLVEVLEAHFGGAP